jgi:hypothetical protein
MQIDIGDRKVMIPSPEKWRDRDQELIAWFNKLNPRKISSSRPMALCA